MKNVAFAAFFASIFVSPLSHATEDSGPSRPSLGALQRIIASRSPETTVATPDHDRITAQRIDIVDENGVIRMTLSGRTPAPIIDGIQYRRAFNVAGLVLYDDKGSERGGFGTADVAGGMAIGWRVSPDGEVAFSINQAPPLLREPALGNRLVPGVKTSTRIRMVVGADGTPAIALNDKADKTRLRLTVTEEGYGAIEFLNAQGEVIHTLAPEADAEPAKAQ